MNASDVIKLINAGFTANEIRKLETAPAPEQIPAALDPEPASATAPDPEPTPAAAPDPEPAPADPDPLDAIKQQIAGLTTVVQTMSKAIVMPNLDNVTPKGIDDVVQKFFKED